MRRQRRRGWSRALGTAIGTVVVIPLAAVAGVATTVAGPLSTTTSASAAVVPHAYAGSGVAAFGDAPSLGSPNGSWARS